MPDPVKAGAAAPGAPLVLAFDAAGSACSVLVARGSEVLAEQRRPMRHGHAEALMPMVDAAMRACRQRSTALDIVGTSIGPGGFTGIRTAIAAAQGIALGARAQLIGVTGFEAVRALALPDLLATGNDVSALLVALDSRRDDMYVQLFRPDLPKPEQPEAVLAERLEAWVAERIGERTLAVAGDAAATAAAAFARRRLRVIPGSSPDARGVLVAALARASDPAPSGPVRAFYLRPPDVTVRGDARPRPSHA